MLGTRSASRCSRVGVPARLNARCRAGQPVAVAARRRAQVAARAAAQTRRQRSSRRTALVAAVERASRRGRLDQRHLAPARRRPARPGTSSSSPRAPAWCRATAPASSSGPTASSSPTSTWSPTPSKVVVTLPDGTDLPAKVLGEDPLTDIAVLKVDRQGLPDRDHRPQHRPHDRRVGRGAGQPLRLPARQRRADGHGRRGERHRPQHPPERRSDRPLPRHDPDRRRHQPRQLGRPAHQRAGRGGRASTRRSSATAAARSASASPFPIERALRVADEIIKNGTVRRAWVGLEVEGAAAMRNWKSQGGVVVAGVAPDGPAARAGPHARATSWSRPTAAGSATISTGRRSSSTSTSATRSTSSVRSGGGTRAPPHRDRRPAHRHRREGHGAAGPAADQRDAGRSRRSAASGASRAR